MNLRNLAIWGVIILGAMAFYVAVSRPGGIAAPAGAKAAASRPVVEMNYTQLVEARNTNQIKAVTVRGSKMTGELKNGTRFKAFIPQPTQPLLDSINDTGAQVDLDDPAQSIWVSALIGLLPFVLIIGLWVLIMRQMQGGARGAMGFGKSKAKLLTEHKGRKTFDDVAGVDEAKEELQEVVDFLKDPGKFQKLGGKIPKGALLVGPPGTGKTLLARAVAGEAGVPFFSISGSDFVEMFVGVGASRVRDMFEQGKKNAPCILSLIHI